MRFGIEFVPSTPTLDMAYYSRIAEKVGFEFVWITDHFVNRNVFVALTQVALYTNTIQVGSGVTNPYTANPAIVASSIATIDEISGYRAILGIGAGDKVTLRNLGVERKKALRAMRESVDIIRSLWARDTVTLDGEVFKVPKARLGFKVKRAPPIYLAAQGPKMLSLAAEMADGVLINASHPKDYYIAKKQLEIGAKRSQRRIKDFDIAAYTSFSINKDFDRAVKESKIVVAFIVAGSLQLVLDRHNIAFEEASTIDKLLFDGKFKKAAEMVTPEMLNAFAIYGTPKDCIQKIDELAKVGVTQIVCGSPLGRNIPEAIKLIGKAILPEFLSRW